jgi:hypothetical protein
VLGVSVSPWVRWFASALVGVTRVRNRANGRRDAMPTPLLLVLALVAAGEAIAPEKGGLRAAEVDWIVLPILQFNDDAGMIYGLHFPIGSYDGERLPYVWFAEAKLRHSTRNRHEHYALFDLRHVFDFRVTLRADFLHIDDANFFGVANSARVDHLDAQYRYRLTEPRALGFIIGPTFDPRLTWGAGLSASATRTRVDEGGLLARDRPLGWDGGRSVVGLLSFAFDSRDSELVPSRGQFIELYLKAATRPLGSTYSFQGAGLTAHAYHALLPWLVFAQRAMVESLGGAVPFYEQNRIGGRAHVFGLGGVFTQRGFAEARFIGRNKVLSNSELRFYLPTLFERLTLGVGAFLDVSTLLDRVGPDHPLVLHPSVGAAISVQWRKLILFRVDYGVSQEGGLLYIEGRHLF